MPNYVLSTCGTSLITNGTQDNLRKLINQYTNCSDWAEVPVDIAHQLKRHLPPGPPAQPTLVT